MEKLSEQQEKAWLKVLTSQFPDKPKEEIRILDIGTGPDRKSTRLNSSHDRQSRMPSSA